MPHPIIFDPKKTLVIADFDGTLIKKEVARC